MICSNTVLIDSFQIVAIQQYERCWFSSLHKTPEKPKIPRKVIESINPMIETCFFRNCLFHFIPKTIQLKLFTGRRDLYCKITAFFSVHRNPGSLIMQRIVLKNWLFCGVDFLYLKNYKPDNFLPNLEIKFFTSKGRNHQKAFKLIHGSEGW